MSYQVLARKWRPRRFADLVGQTHVVRALTHALDHDRVHHAFLFTGTRGVGKTTIARILAKSLNCESGVSSQPCGSCRSCQEVDEGRFVDLLEVDAASRTKVDDTRELLDNVQYAPTRGRYKVYLIDEVHMLSPHSFNALLKTLEEPPPHVKFLLATTDPQKLPATVLSRCLQFHLKRLGPEQIEAQLARILGAESIPFDVPALRLLAYSADGSMRDALSLLDQSIAYAGGRVGEVEVREMLGTIDDTILERILDGLAAADAAGLLAAAVEANERSADADLLLGELLRRLHAVALAQLAPELLLESEPFSARARALAGRMSAEDVQLYYQMAVLGRRDLGLAPDARTGLEMTLLRMLAFRPAAAPASGGPGRARAEGPAPAAAAPARPVSAAAPSPVPSPVRTPAVAEAAPAVVPAAAPADAAASAWGAMVGAMKLGGLVRELAQHCVLEALEPDAVRLTLDVAVGHLLNKEREAALRQALEQHLGRGLALSVRIGRPAAETPAAERQRTERARQQAAAAAIANDPTVQALQETFNARVTPDSVRPRS